VIGRHVFGSAAIAGATVWIALFIPVTAFRLLVPEAFRGFNDIKWASILGDAATNLTLVLALATIAVGGWNTDLTPVLALTIGLSAVLVVVSATRLNGKIRPLGVEPAIGRNFRPDEDKAGAAPVVILSHALWQRRFGGSHSAVGQVIVLNGEPTTIIGVMPEAFHGIKLSEWPRHVQSMAPLAEIALRQFASSGMRQWEEQMEYRRSDGPRTLLLVTAPLSGATEGKAVLEALARLARLDIAIAVPAGGDRTLTDRAAVLAIEHPGKVAVVSEAITGGDRALLAGADALLLADPDDHTARPAGFALRYGTLPIAPEGGANADYVVDHDPLSGTGCALLYSAIDPFQIEGAVRRAVALRANAEVWQALVPSLMLAAPRWSATVAALEGIDPPVAAALAASA